MSMQQEMNASELKMELENLKAMLSGSRDELKFKDKKIESLQLKLEKAGEFELQLKKKLTSFRQAENDMMMLLAENKKMIRALEAEVDLEKQAEAKIINTLEIQAKQLETIKIELEKSQIENTYLSSRLESLENFSDTSSNSRESVEFLKNEAKQALDADEKSRKAMEDLAWALKEVATEANHSKEKLLVAENELDQLREEAKQLKEMLRGAEERAKLYKNTSDRLRLEADDTLLAWNGKEIGFVNCIKQAEEEKSIAQRENVKLAESLRVVREESYNLRGILKQAISEANAAKAAGAIAREENSQLKDCLAEKEEALHFLTREKENIEQNRNLIPPSRNESKKNMGKTFISFNSGDLKVMPEEEKRVLDEDDNKTEALKGSIFDDNVETPRGKSVRTYQRRHSSISSFTGEIETLKVEDLDKVHDDSESDKNSNKKVRTMFRRVGDLLAIRRSHQ